MSKPELPRFIQLSSALQEFVTVEGTQAQQHIRPLHQYLTVRLVLEGGFDPGEITPHPPLRVESKGQRKLLRFAPDKEDNREQTLLGGLKSKAVDVVVTKEGIGPVLAISVKGTGNAFRNLTNRMEEAIGDSTNLHIMYPGLVYGFLHFLKANREGEAPLAPNDIALTASGEPVTWLFSADGLKADGFAGWHKLVLGGRVPEGLLDNSPAFQSRERRGARAESRRDG